MPSGFLIRIEGCNFAATAYDTDDLSTIRGASLAYLDQARTWPAHLDKYGLAGVEEIVVGASDGIYAVESANSRETVETAVAAAIRAAPTPGDPLDATRPFLTFAYAVVPATADYAKDVAHLVALCRQRQLQQLSIDVPSPAPGVGDACPFDGIRPADTRHKRQDDEEVMVSAAVAARRSYGRTARQQFYKRELVVTGDLGLTFSDSFQDLVTGNPPGLPPALTGKHAVVYLDGNKFTKIRQEIVFGAGGPASTADVRTRQRTFSDDVQRARRCLLKSLLSGLSRDPHMLLGRPTDFSMGALKFETLLWGGDEALFVLPAWPIARFLELLAGALDDPAWQLSLDAGYKLSHAVGVVISSVQTPIAVSRRLAEDIANSAKELALKGASLKTARNVFSLQILESVEPPRDDLAGFRKALYGTDKAEAFTLVGSAEVTGFLKLIRRFQNEDGGLPRSQLFKLIGSARKQSLLDPANAAKALTFLDREADIAFKRCKCGLLQELRSPLLGYTKEAPLLPLLRLAELWDYVDPLGRAAPRQVEVQAT